MEKHDILASYLQDGFVIVKDVFCKKDVEDCKKDLIEICLAASFCDEEKISVEEALKKVFLSSKERYLQVLRTFAKSATLQKLFLSNDLMEIIKTIGIHVPTMPTQPVTHVCSIDLLIEGNEVGIDSHQDWPSIQGSLDSVVVWTPFTIIDEKSYPIQVLPKSHLSGVREAKIKKNGSMIELSEEEENSVIDVLCSPGDAVIFSTFVVHKTKNCKKNDEKFRFATSTRFDNALEKSFVERNFPCAYKRTVERNLESIPSKEQINLIFERK